MGEIKNEEKKEYESQEYIKFLSNRSETAT